MDDGDNFLPAFGNRDGGDSDYDTSKRFNMFFSPTVQDYLVL